MALDPNRPGRLRCEVVGCNRTADASKYEEGTAIICGKCWRLGGTSETRRTYGKFAREADALDAKLQGLHNARQPLPADLVARHDRCARKAHRLWDAIRQGANEARGGI